MERKKAKKFEPLQISNVIFALRPAEEAMKIPMQSPVIQPISVSAS
ncbi:MAG: hypothetical protein QXK18_00970 [Candidatus Bathyarchaeia archaeon]